MAASNGRGEKGGDRDMSHVRVGEQRAMLNPEVVTSAVQPAVSGSAVGESANRRAHSGPVSEEATDVTVSSAVQQMASVRISDEQQTLSRPVRHGAHSGSPAQNRRRGLSDQTAIGSQPGADRHDGVGHTQSEQGWHRVYDSVMSLPHERVIRSVVEECAPDWYRLGIELGFKDSHIRSMTSDILTPQSKLQAIIERKSMEHGKENTVKALLDVCDKIMPLTTIDVMKNLGIKYIATVSDRSLYELGKMVGHDWKKLAKCLGLTSQDMENIKKKARSSRKRARMMLQLWHAKSKGDFRVQEIYEIVEQIRKRKQTKQQTKHMIFPENVHSDKRVCGRSRELEGIATEFWGQTAADRMTPSGIPKYCLQVVNGMGGAGKSALSEKYAAEWLKMYEDGVFHFNAESLAALHNSIRRNLRSVSRKSEGGVFDDNQIFLQYVYSKDKVLLLYDGADDLELLKNVLPCDTAHVHVLVTTRMSGSNPILARANKITSLGPLGIDAGVEALQSWRGHASEELDGEELIFAKRLVSESPIEGLPLAITHVATRISMGRMSYQQYYYVFKKEQRVLQALSLDMDKLLQYFRISSLKEPLMHQGICKPNDLSRLSVEDIQSIAMKQNDRHLLSMARYFIMNSNHVHLTWQLDIETMKNTDSNATNLLLYISLMSCKNIPERVVRPLLFKDVFAYQYHMSVSTLRSHALVDVSESNEGSSLHMHPLVQSTLLERVMRQPEELHYRLNRMAHNLLSLLPLGDSDIQRHLKDDQFLSLIPHVYAVAEKAVWIHDDETCDTLVDTACMIAYQFQHIDVAAYLCNERLKATVESASNWQRLQALYEMGKAFELMANPQSAQLQFMEALQLIENSSAQEKARMENYYRLVLDRLAECYRNQQMFTDAERLYQTLLSLLKERPEENRQGITTALHNLAVSYCESGQTQKAIETYEEVLEMEGQDPETPSLSLSQSMQNMAWSLMENGQLEEALPLLERSLSVMREHLPGDHVELAKALGKLSRCCEELGDVQRAMSLCEESVAIASQCLPNGHPLTAAFVGQLARCHRRAGRLDQAIHLTQHCISILRQSVPSTRKELCTCLNNLGTFYKEKGMLSEAVSSLEECLAARRLFLTADHPDIGETLWNLGAAYKARNDVIKATELWRECLSVFEKCLSATHPALLNVLMELGSITYDQGQYHESLQMYGRSLDILMKVSAKSMETATVLMSLGSITYDQGQYHESLQMYGRSLDILMKVSPKSMKTATACHNMGHCYVKLSQFDTAEEALSQALSIFTAILPQEHHQISNTEQALHTVWQLKFGQW